MSTSVAGSTALPRVSVVMPVRDEGPFIRESLGAVLAQDYPRDLIEVIVVDGMSRDSTREEIQSMRADHANLRMLDNPRGIVATGMNAGMAAAGGEIIVRVDGHCVIAPDYVRRCVEHLQNDGVDGVGGPVRTVGETATARAIAAAMSSKFGVGGSAFRTISNRTMLADTVPFPAYWRGTVKRAGPYDEELVRNQDDEYNYRLRKLGAKILLASDVKSDYFSRSGFRSLWKQYFQYGLWKVRVLQKHPLQMSARQFVPFVFVLAIVGSLLAGILASTWWPLLCILGVYGLAALLAAVAEAGMRDVSLIPGLFWSFFLLHVGYGSGFLVGLARFARRWGA